MVWGWTSGRSLPVYTFLEYSPLPNEINFLPGDPLLLTDSQFNERQQKQLKFTYNILSSVFSQPIHRTLPLTAVFEFFFPQVKARDLFQR